MFLEKLDALMAEKGINKKNLSAGCGIPYNTIIGFYKKGHAHMRLSNAVKLCSYFHVPLDYLVWDILEEQKPEAAEAEPRPASCEILKTILEEKCMGPEALAERTGFSKHHINFLLTGTDGFALRDALTLSRTLGVSLERLNGEKEPEGVTAEALEIACRYDSAEPRIRNTIRAALELAPIPVKRAQSNDA